ncbi:MAG TPA: glutamate--tRNA ligase [Terriglobia bacterium]|nr:glutamate--tRNA ligase [Terriglobia bacterium]
MNPIRVRFAPSPTGYLHVGGARTALYNWLFARHHGGVFILRIEDTDADRSRPELVTAILESMEWLGLHWDEGPYFQSRRLDRYREIAAQLEKSGWAYPCFCSTEELRQARERAAAEHRAWKYDRRCLRLSESDRARLRAEGRPSALRFRVPEGGSTAFEDQVFGRIELAHSELEDFVLLRSDGQPTYHLGVVADDLDMKITHVIRGADHLSNTPKQILMYQALGAEIPAFAHLPLILGPDRQRLSKRHGATAVGAYREQGILPEALVNFLALLGWTPPEQKELLSLDEMTAVFSLEGVSKSNAVFDLEKLAWMNSEYLRRLPLPRLASLVQSELESAGLWQTAWSVAEREEFEKRIALLQPRARNLKDFTASSRAFFSDEFEYDPGAAKKFWKDPALADLLQALATRLAEVSPFNTESAEKCLRALAEEKGVKAGLLINGARVALTGQAVAPGIFDVMATLGEAATVERLDRAAKHLAANRGLG